MIMLMVSAGNGGGMDLWKILWQASPISKVVFLLLIACSVLSIAVIIERWIVLNRARAATEAGVRQIEAWGVSQALSDARSVIVGVAREQNPLFSVLQAGMAQWDALQAVGETRLSVMETMVNEAVNRELKQVRSMLRTNLAVLANISSVAPFIGLFGTVVGIILTFDAISTTGNMGQELVASGIADALVATAMGLFAAIPAVLAFNYYINATNQLMLSIEVAASEKIYFLVQHAQMDEPAVR
jgi:biopolymer transport protein ExbB/TolQ